VFIKWIRWSRILVQKLTVVQILASSVNFMLKGGFTLRDFNFWKRQLLTLCISYILYRFCIYDNFKAFYALLISPMREKLTFFKYWDGKILKTMNTYTLTAAHRRINFNMNLQDRVKLHKFQDVGVNSIVSGLPHLFNYLGQSKMDNKRVFYIKYAFFLFYITYPQKILPDKCLAIYTRANIRCAAYMNIDVRNCIQLWSKTLMDTRILVDI
jgi:hypothetical protein